MEITKSGSQPSAKGPADWFTGSVRIDSPFQRPAPARIGGATVTFEPGARTAWHTHPLGQTLIVTAGCGCVERDGGPIEEVRAGDIVWFAPGERHWHGASPTTADDAAAAGFRAEADKLTASQRSTLVPADVFDAAIKERTAFQQGRQSPATP